MGTNSQAQLRRKGSTWRAEKATSVSQVAPLEPGQPWSLWRTPVRQELGLPPPRLQPHPFRYQYRPDAPLGPTAEPVRLCAGCFLVLRTSCVMYYVCAEDFRPPVVTSLPMVSPVPWCGAE